MMPQSQKAKSCPICESTRLRVRGASSRYPLIHCEECGLIWDPKYEKAPVALYDEKYFVGGSSERGYADYSRAMEVNKLTFRHRLKVVEKLTGSKGRVLDVGCALGDFLVEARKNGWSNPTGLDVSAYAVEACRSRALEVTQGNLTSSGFAPSTFDAIFLQDMIEHTLDPVAQLQRALALLKPGGIIYLTTPNVKSLSARLLGSRWYHLKPGEHLIYLSKKSMRVLLEKAGFEDVRSRTTLNTMGLGYILERLVPYQPWLIKRLAAVVKFLGLSRIPVTLPIGEMEAWGYKPKAQFVSNVIPLRRKSKA